MRPRGRRRAGARTGPAHTCAAGAAPLHSGACRRRRGRARRGLRGGGLRVPAAPALARGRRGGGRRGPAARRRRRRRPLTLGAEGRRWGWKEAAPGGERSAAGLAEVSAASGGVPPEGASPEGGGGPRREGRRAGVVLSRLPCGSGSVAPGRGLAWGPRVSAGAAASRRAFPGPSFAASPRRPCLRALPAGGSSAGDGSGLKGTCPEGGAGLGGFPRQPGWSAPPLNALLKSGAARAAGSGRRQRL